MTIIEAIKQVMIQHGSPLTARQAYDLIVEKHLYEFHAQDPAHVVLMQIRRHCEGIDFPTAVPTKHFKLVGENKFWPLPEPRRKPRSHPVPSPPKALRRRPESSLASTLEGLQELH